MSRAAGRHPRRRSPARAGSREVLVGVLAELCAAQPAEPGRAEERFAGVHGRLHELAEAVQSHNRGMAAELLEAKRDVEDTLAAPAGARRELAGDLERLVAAVRDALAVLGRPAPSCDAAVGAS